MYENQVVSFCLLFFLNLLRLLSCKTVICKMSLCDNISYSCRAGCKASDLGMYVLKAFYM